MIIKNLTERMKNQSLSNKKNVKDQNMPNNIFSPRKNMKKRSKTEIAGLQTDIFIFGQQNEITNYNKSINRQILKNINLTNSSKPKKEISLVNKKLINSHFYLNTKNNTNTNKNTYTSNILMKMKKLNKMKILINKKKILSKVKEYTHQKNYGN